MYLAASFEITPLQIPFLPFSKVVEGSWGVMRLEGEVTPAPGALPYRLLSKHADHGDHATVKDAENSGKRLPSSISVAAAAAVVEVSTTHFLHYRENER